MCVNTASQPCLGPPPQGVAPVWSFLQQPHSIFLLVFSFQPPAVSPSSSPRQQLQFSGSAFIDREGGDGLGFFLRACRRKCSGLLQLLLDFCFAFHVCCVLPERRHHVPNNYNLRAQPRGTVSARLCHASAADSLGRACFEARMLDRERRCEAGGTWTAAIAANPL